MLAREPLTGKGSTRRGWQCNSVPELLDVDVQRCRARLRGLAAHLLQVRIQGLKGAEYLDSLEGRKRKSEASETVLFNAEVDRIYTGVPGTLQVGPNPIHNI